MLPGIAGIAGPPLERDLPSRPAGGSDAKTVDLLPARHSDATPQRAGVLPPVRAATPVGIASALAFPPSRPGESHHGLLAADRLPPRSAFCSYTL
jgi:hypothetical protein